MKGRPNGEIDNNRKRHRGDGKASYKNYYKDYWERNPDKYEIHKAKMREIQREKWAKKETWNQRHPKKRKKYMKKYNKRKNEEKKKEQRKTITKTIVLR